MANDELLDEPTTEVEETQSPDKALDDIDTNKDGKIDVSEATKYFLHSRTFQVNIVAMIALLVQHKFGFVIGAEIQSEILIFINLWLRTKTTTPIKWSK
ncbi:MAG: hypothetical protein CTY12_06360 [Methylotenera sp.]|nr:MAG: hypothetical protein CTY12_06360 [Methylotenera sp.]